MRDRLVLAAAFLASLLAVGLPYWRIPYRELSLPSDIWGYPLLLVAGLAGLAIIVSAGGFWRTTLVVSASVPAAVMARVVYDVVSDSTSHNLWPIELVLAAGPGFIAAFAGASIGWLLTGGPRNDKGLLDRSRRHR